MRVLVFASQKGGVGKSTLASSIAAAARGAGENVVVVDMDPQGSVAEWVKARDHLSEHEEPAPAKIYLREVKPANLDAWITETRRVPGVSLVVIDTAGTFGPEVEVALKHADLALVPVQPSAHDLRATGKTVGQIRRVGGVFAFVLNRTNPVQTRKTSEVMAALTVAGEVAGVVADRTDFRDSAASGLGVTEAAPDSKAAREIGLLWKAIQKRMETKNAA
jgi:chromosome partitioning protein